MSKLVLYLLCLVASLFLILYLDDIGHLVLYSGGQKIIVNLWFALAVLLLISSIVIWLYRFFSRFFKIHGFWKAYRLERTHKEKQHARTQALMYALCGNYNAAVGHMSIDRDQTIMSDLLLYAVWLNKIEDLQQLDVILGKIQASERLPDGWMVWFRSYLLFDRGKQDLAVQVLLDALDAGVHSPQIIKALAEYADPSRHYQHIMRYYDLVSRYVDKDFLTQVVLKGVSVLMDDMIKDANWTGLSDELKKLPNQVLKSSEVTYYQARLALAQGQTSEAVSFIERANFEKDYRLVALIPMLGISAVDKLKLVEVLLGQYPGHKELLYLLSYLHAQEGDVVDTVKMLESAMAS